MMMKLFQDIKTEFDKVITHCFKIDNPKTEDIFEQWYKNKKRFINIFGGNPILEVGPVKMSLSDTTKNKRLDSFLTEIDDYGYGELYRFIAANREGFFKNKTVNPYECYNGETIPPGVKMLKNFKHFIVNSDALAKWQNAASAIIQEDKIEGTLCISVHPLDYLSSSENCHKWRSCHALDGDYAQGNISYMIDRSTVLCYIKSSNGDIYNLPNFPKDVPWNSKKWRMLLFFEDNDQMVFAGKQYPFEIDGILSVISDNFINEFDESSNDWISDLWCEVFPALNSEPENYQKWTKWNNEYFDEYNGEELLGKHIYLNHRIYTMDDSFIKDEKNAHHYNDLLYSSVYKKPYYTFRSRSCDRFHFSIGSRFKCLECGEDHYTVDLMRCSNCLNDYNEDSVLTCSCCGRNIYTEEENVEFLYDSTPICEECFNDESIIQCPRCGYHMYESEAHFHNDDLICPICIDLLKDEVDT